MTKTFRFTLIALVICAAPHSVYANDPVDLRGKKGVVDPADLKKHDPPERSLKTKEPPPPKPQKQKSDTPPKSPPNDQGQSPGPGGLPVPGIDPRRHGPTPVPGR